VADQPKLIMYCRPWCGDCERARMWLYDHGVDYVEIDIEADAGAHERAASYNSGEVHTPTFELGEEVCVDFRPDRLSVMLGIK